MIEYIFKGCDIVKENYQIRMEQIIEKEQQNGKVPTLLLHACCAPCSSSVLEKLSSFFEITIYYYNPNISPYEEYEKRVNEIKRFIKELKVENPIHFLEGKYDNESFEAIAKGLENEPEGGARCSKCYYLRLKETALVAQTHNFDYFTTTLSVSPYKNAEKLNKIGLALEKEYNVYYLVSDFKKKDGYKRSIELSKQYNLYRQDYCGCIYSKREVIE